MKNQIKRNVYYVSLWEVSTDDENETQQDLLDRAIEVARERQRVYHMPATWEAQMDGGKGIKVTCYHN